MVGACGLHNSVFGCWRCLRCDDRRSHGRLVPHTQQAIFQSSVVGFRPSLDTPLYHDGRCGLARMACRPFIKTRPQFIFHPTGFEFFLVCVFLRPAFARIGVDRHYRHVDHDRTDHARILQNCAASGMVARALSRLGQLCCGVERQYLVVELSKSHRINLRQS